MTEISQKKICDILSLQENGLYLGEKGKWKMQGKKKHGGNLRIQEHKK